MSATILYNGSPAHAETNPVEGAARKPNIIVIMTDEHNASVMGCAGDSIARTPSMDRLAAQGILFSAHYCGSPICIPSRQTFTTGKYVSRHNVWGNSGGVPESTPSIARLLNAAGYESFLDGKMHYQSGRSYGFALLTEDGTGQELAQKSSPEEEEKSGKSRTRQRVPAEKFTDNGTKLGKEFSSIGATDDMDKFVDTGRRKSAVTFLNERKTDDKPFFLVVGFIAPHYPLLAPAELLAHFKDKVPMPEIPEGYLEQLPLNYKHLRNERAFERVPDETIKLARESYYARTEWIDQQIGEVLDALKSSAHAENTIVIYTSDHGENMGEHGLWWKNCMYDTSARVPLIISWPARWKGGQVRPAACGSVDLAQTIAELAGTKAPADWNGSSMVPWLDDPKYAWKDLAVSEFYATYISSGMAMIRQGDWKYVYHTRADEKHGPERELYHMTADPKELRNLAGDPAQQDRVSAMHAALVKELGEDPEKSEARWRAGAGPGEPR